MIRSGVGGVGVEKGEWREGVRRDKEKE